MKKWIPIALCFAFVAQSLALSGLIWQHYQAQNKGKVFLFQTVPIDPRDYFRGQYVALAFDAVNQQIANDICQNQEKDKYVELMGKYYAALQENAKGLAEITFVSKNPPNHEDYVVVKHVYCTADGQLRFDLPFNRYYANENEAQPMEIAARQHPEQTFLQVAVYGGHYAVQQLILPKNSGNH